MQTVICDTSVWYHIANGSIPLEKLKNKKLVVSHVNVTEIASTQHLTKRFDVIYQVIRVMYENHQVILPINPMDHLIKLFYPSFITDTNTFERILSGFNQVIDNYPEIKLTDEVLKTTQNKIDDIRKSLNTSVDHTNDVINQIRTIIKQNNSAQKHSKTDFLKGWKIFISDWVKQYSERYYNKTYSLDPEHTSWDKLEFFIRVWEEYFKKLELDNTSKFDKNDWADLLNMVYVQPWCKFWIREKKWHDIFNRNELLKKYVIPFNG